MLRRGRAGVGVVVQWVVLEEAALLNAGQASAQHAPDDLQEGLGVVGGEGGGLHAGHRASPMRRCTDSRSAERPATLANDCDRDLRQALRDEGHTVDSLAATLGCARSIAGDLLAGRRRWTDYQRAKLARGRAA